MTNLKTENLVILFCDIVGFTESTNLMSREQHKRMLDSYNNTLLPIVKRFRGRHIKSIGDALLLAFSSPTDGMRCAMAMMDAMHEYNISAQPGEEIRVRIAASLGEVRVTKNDIFGEPVNVTSRIESITPQDEIYFSEAVYLAMNKAEVPALEVGLHELKGISKPVKIFAIPRFAQNRLVPDTTVPSPGDPRLTYPYGGMHLMAETANYRAAAQRFPDPSQFRPGTIGTIAAAVLVVVGTLAYQALSSERAPLVASVNTSQSRTEPLPAPQQAAEPPQQPPQQQQQPAQQQPVQQQQLAQQQQPVQQQPVQQQPAQQQFVQPGGQQIVGQQVVQQVPQQIAAPAAAAVNAPPVQGAAISQPPQQPVANSGSQAVGQVTGGGAGTTALAVAPAQAATTPIGSVVAQPAQQPQVARPKNPPSSVISRAPRPQVAEPRKPAISTIIQAKQAYRAALISKEQYRSIVEHLESEYDMYVRRAKIEYRDGQISKEQYRSRIVSLKLKYIGED